MDWKRGLVIVGIILFLIASFFIITNVIITGKVIGISHHTQAICDDNNFCQDYEVYCDGEILLNLIPISGAAIHNLENWTDPRGTDGNKLC